MEMVVMMMIAAMLVVGDGCNDGERSHDRDGCNDGDGSHDGDGCNNDDRSHDGDGCNDGVGSHYGEKNVKNPKKLFFTVCYELHD